MTDQLTTPRTWTEAPASLTVKFYRNGYDVMLTLRAETGGEVLAKLDQAVAWLDEHGAYPTAPRSNGNGNGAHPPEPAAAPQPAQAPTLANGAPDPGWCPLHNCAMQRRERNGEVWYSHKNGEGYCKGKV